ncbi:MAG: extracellular solute-binding protein [Inquilinaceae bacterium]
MTRLWIAAALVLVSPLIAGPVAGQTTDDGTTGRIHGITEYGEPPRYGPDFEHWDYVNPDAPKGGRLTMATIGTFDSLNSYIVRGVPAAGVSLLYEGLLTGNSDELTAVYVDVAEWMELADDRTWGIFKIREGARFHDGTPITAADVVFSQNLLRDQGAPRFKTRFYDAIESVEALDESTVKITAKSADDPTIVTTVATFPILPAHWWEGRDFTAPSLEPPLGSGPYRIKNIDAGRSITYERVEDWWGRDLPHNVGQFNFDEIHYDYYRDVSVMFEAFKAGRFDFTVVSSSLEWSTGFEGLDQVDDGRLILEEIESGDPQSFGGFWFNLRRPMFQDIRVREAITQLYDFETARRTIHYNLYQRLGSYFPNTESAATGLPDGDELAILENYRGRIPDHIFTQEFTLPVTRGDGNIRTNLREATRLFAEAGWEISDGRLINAETGRQMTIELLYRSPNLEKVIQQFANNLRRAGIEANLRLVDTAQYGVKMDNHDFDMVFLGIVPFYPPSTPLRSLWRSENVDEVGAENFTGVQDPILDELVERVVNVTSWDEMIAATRALDRYLLWQYLAVPTYYDDKDRIAYWDVFARPETKPEYGLGFPTTWWYDTSNTGALPANR